MQRRSTGLLHCGYRTSRVELQRTTYGQDKTIFSLIITGSLFLVNLGTGEVVAARTSTAIAQTEQAGEIQELPSEDTLALAGTTASSLVDTLLVSLAERAQLGLVEAIVAKQLDATRVVVAHGALDGAYRGESFGIEGLPGVTARLVAIQGRFSVALLSEPRSLDVGRRLSRPGLRLAGGQAPRLLVQISNPDLAVAPGVTAGEIGTWVEDGLAQAGFAVVPSGAAFLAAQLAEASDINIATSALVGAQSLPDLVVLPSVVDVLVFEERDEDTRSDIHVLEAGVALAFVPVRGGTVDFGVVERARRTETIQEGGRTIDLNRAFKALLKDAALTATAVAGRDYSVRTLSSTLTSPASPAGVVNWAVDVAPLGAGTVAEVFRLGPEIPDPQDGVSLGRLEELVGTVRVESSTSRKESGTVMAAATPLQPGMLVRAIASTRSMDRHIVELGQVTILEPSLPMPARRVRSSVLAALHGAPAFRSTPSAEAGDWIEGLSRELSSGAYSPAPGDESRMVTGLPPTHRLELDLLFEAGPVEASGRLVERVLKISVNARLIDLEAGESVTLVDPQGKAWTEYPMWQRRTLRAKKTRGKLAVGLADSDVSEQLEKLLFEAATELYRRLGIMAGSSP